MKIDTRAESGFGASPPVLPDSSRFAATSFRDLFEMAMTNVAEGASATDLAGSGTTESAYQTAVRELQEYLQKTPEQRMREAILKEMGLSEDDIKKMPPEQQSTVEAAIREKVKEKLLEQAQARVHAAVGALRYAGDSGAALPAI